MKQTKKDENQTASHVLKLKDQHDDYQVIIYNLTNAENQDLKIERQKETLQTKIQSLK